MQRPKRGPGPGNHQNHKPDVPEWYLSYWAAAVQTDGRRAFACIEAARRSIQDRIEELCLVPAASACEIQGLGNALIELGALLENLDGLDKTLRGDGEVGRVSERFLDL